MLSLPVETVILYAFQVIFLVTIVGILISRYCNRTHVDETVNSQEDRKNDHAEMQEDIADDIQFSSPKISIRGTINSAK